MFCGSLCERIKKKKVTDWEKRFSDHVPDRELVHRVYKELSKLDGKTQSEDGQRT